MPIGPASLLLLSGLVAYTPQGTATGDPVVDPGRPALRLETGIGFDLFRHSYQVLSADTSSTLSDGNAFLDLLWSPLQDPTRQLDLGNRFYLSNEYFHNVVSGYWSRVRGRGLSWTADARWETKRFLQDGLSYANDHDAWQAGLRAEYRWRDRWGVRTRLQADSFDYAQRSDFFYDTRSWAFETGVGGGSWFGPWWELAAGLGAQAAPDTSALDHDNRHLRLRAGWVFADAGDVSAELEVSRRDYPTGGPRPDRDLTALEVYGRLRPLETWGAWFDLSQTRYQHAEQTLVYNDATERRLTAGPAWHPSYSLEVRVGAGLTDRTSEGFTDTSYVDLFGVTRIVDAWRQPFLFTEVTLFTTGGLWMMVSLEAGRREYDDATDWDSDFTYLDLGGTAEVPLAGGLALQLLFNYTPEQHREPEDNRVTNYTSVDLIWRFR
jgi:hypothetical protein